MKKIAILFMTLLIGLTGCSYQGSFRYPCQDSANWDNAECNPPVCEPLGTCSRDLVGETTWDEYQKSKANNG